MQQDNIDVEVDPVSPDTLLHEKDTLWKVTILDRDGSDLGSFHMDSKKSILENAEENGIDIWYSCRSGACFACGCHIVAGKQYVDIGKFDIPLVDVEEDDCLSCISGVDDNFDGEIILKKF